MRQKLLKMGLLSILLVIVTGCSSTQDAGQTDKESNIGVTWQDPDNYRDIRAADEHKERFRKSFFKEMENYLRRLGNKLPEGVRLDMTFTDIDLAGQVKYMFDMGREVRVMESPFWPSLKFNVVIKKNGKVIGDKNVELKEMMYLDKFVSNVSSTDTLRYEKQMLSDWLERDLLPSL